MKTDTPNQSGIKGELVIQKNHVGPESQPSANNRLSARVLKWGGERRKLHPAVSQSHTSWPALMGWSQTRARHCVDPAAGLAEWAASPTGLESPTLLVKI